MNTLNLAITMQKVVSDEETNKRLSQVYDIILGLPTNDQITSNGVTINPINKGIENNENKPK